MYLTNFLRFDFLIFILGAVDFYFLLRASHFSREIEEKLFPRGYTPGGWNNYGEMKKYYTSVMSLGGEEELITLRRKMNSAYTVFENITAVFPLMGLLGTVLSLIPMVDSLGNAGTGLFFSALTSTMWGIVFAIAARIVNSFTESRLMESERNIQNFLDRYSSMVRNDYEETQSDN